MSECPQPNDCAYGEAIRDTQCAVGRIDKRLERLERALIGNGRPGLQTRTAVLEAWRKGHDERMSLDARNINARSGRGLQVATLVVGGLGMLTALIVAIAK